MLTKSVKVQYIPTGKGSTKRADKKPKCIHERVYRLNEFADGAIHLERYCKLCGKHSKFLPSKLIPNYKLTGEVVKSDRVEKNH